MATADPQSVEEVRRSVLAEHEEIRALLDEVTTLAERFESGDESEGRDLRARGLVLYKRLSAHLETEEQLLIGRLRGSGAEQLVSRLEREHREQRELLSYLLGRLGESTLPTILIARELRSFAEYVRQDMSYEEDTLLPELALHD